MRSRTYTLVVCCWLAGALWLVESNPQGQDFTDTQTPTQGAGELRHSLEQVIALRRMLQQSSSGVCEIDVLYDVIDVTQDNFTAKFTVIDNRDLDSKWQLAFKFADYKSVGLVNITDGAALSWGSVDGEPARLIGTFQDGKFMQEKNSTFKTIAEFNPNPATGSESLLIESLGVNGLQCSQLWPAPSDRLEHRRCYGTMSFFSAFAGTNRGSGARGDVCRASFCCGFILQDDPQVLIKSGVTPGPEPAAELAPALPPGDILVLNSQGNPNKDGQGVALPPMNEDILVSMSVQEGSASEQGAVQPEELTSAPITAVDASSPEGRGTMMNGTEPETSKEESVTHLIGGVAAIAVLVVIIAVLVIIWLVRQGKAKQQVQPEDHSDGEGSLKSQGSMPTGVSIMATASGSPVVGGTLGSALSMKSMATLNNLTQISPTLSHTSSLAPSGSDAPLSSPTTVGPQGQPPSEDGADDVVLYEQLGSGAFGTVYRGLWNSQPVAVKVLQTSCPSSSRELKSFRQEIAVLSRLRHPNIISFYAACTVPPDICIVEELAEGGSLHEKLHGKPGERRRMPLPYDQLLKVAIDVAEAMRYLHYEHAPKIVHRDLKSQNVLLDAGGRAKVCDFGIAKFKDKTFVSTVNGQAGTPAFMAPELFDGAQATEKVDVYSYAILLWEMYTGLLPWANVPSPMQIIYYVGVLQQRPPLPKACPPVLKEVIEACWAEQPSTRPGFDYILNTLKQQQKAVQEAGWAGGDGGGGGSLDGAPGDNIIDEFEGYALHSYSSPTEDSQLSR